jgi:uncharacterized membrane protein YqjE
MAISPFSAPGLLNSLRELADGVVASAEDRLELISVELQEEKFRLIRNFVWLGAALFIGVLALMFVSLAVVFCFQGGARLLALGAFAVVYTAAFVGIVLGARRHLAREPRPFAATLEEFGRDRECIRPES